MARENPTVNRSLKDKAFDHIDHALGRPMWPLEESYRNYFATEPNSLHAEAFGASPHWELGGVQMGMAYFHVTLDGRKALAEHLAAVDPSRVFVVSYRGHERFVSSVSHAAAKYAYWLDVGDLLPDLTFVEFAADVRVRLVAA